MTVDGRDTDLSHAVRLLGEWDGRFDLDSVGAVIWREFIGSFTETEVTAGGPLWAIPFDPEHPVDTPRDLNRHESMSGNAGSDPVTVAAARAVRALEDAGVPLDAALGEVQYAVRGTHRIPVHGGPDSDGMLNVVTAIAVLAGSALDPAAPTPPPVPGRSERTGLHHGGYPCVYGASFLMFVELHADGPRGEGLLVYGQSGDPASVHHHDQFEAFSRKELRPLLFEDADIESDPALVTVRVR